MKRTIYSLQNHRWKILFIALLAMIQFSIAQETTIKPVDYNKIEQIYKANIADNYNKVLLINSYHTGYQWTDTISKEISKNLSARDLKIELFIENLDSKRIGTPLHWQKKVHNILDAYPKNYLDIILVSDDNAMNAVLSNMDESLSQIPIIFCGVSNFDHEKYGNYKNITGIEEKANNQKTIDLALDLFPATKNIAVITDDTTTGRSYKEQFETLLSQSGKNIIWLDGTQIYYKQLLEKLAELPNDTIVIMGIWQRDCLGDYYKMENTYPEIADICQHPVFGITDLGFGYGILGGYIACAETQASKLSEYVKEVLKNPDMQLPPVHHLQELDYKFDLNQMKRWGIHKHDLAKNTVYVNKPQPLAKSVVMTLWAAAIALFMLIGLTVSLIIYIKRYKKISHQHNQHYKQTSLLWDNIPVWCGAVNAEGEILLSNETGPKVYTNVTNKWYKNAAHIMQTIHKCIGEDHVQEIFFECRDKTWHGMCKPVPYEFFNQTAVILMTKDVTEHEQIKIETIEKNKILNMALKAVKSCHWIWMPDLDKMIIDEHFWLCQDITPNNDTTEQNISFFWQNLNPLDEEFARDQLTKLSENIIDSCKFECRLNYNGQDTWFLIRANILSTNSYDRPDKISIFMTKIHSIKLTELELKEKEKQLSVAQEMAKLGYWSTDISAQITTASSEMFKIMGIQQHSNGKCKTELFREKIVDQEKWKELLSSLTKSGDEVEYIGQILTDQEDTYKTVWSKISLKLDENQNPIYIGISQDITEHTKMQNELKNREKYLLQAASLAKMFYWHYDVNSKNFIFTNSSAVWGENNVDGVQSVYTIIDRIHPEDRKGCSDALQRAMSGEMPKGSFTYRSIHNGIIKYLTTLWEAYFNSDGTLESMIGISMDVTDAKEREKLEISKMKAEAMAKTKSRFLATMSHEIRTPINVVIGMTHLLKDTDLDDVQRNFSNKIDHAASSLLNIVNDVLDISKIEENKLTIENIDFSLNEIAFNNASVMAIGAEKKDVELHVVIDKNLPARLFGDPLRLSQILTNYISNAVKFTDHGDISLLIKPVEKNDNTITIEFAVKDSGIGIAPENLDKLFDAYTQAEKSTTRKFGGTGLGLAICKQLAELMGGSIRAESTPGQGSTFFVTLPFEIPDDAGEQATHKIPELKGKKAIIVDDNDTSRKVLKELISTAGFDVTVTASGQEALEQMEQAETPFELAIIDWSMPDMNGIQTSREITQRYNNNCPKMIAVTAHNHENVMHQCLSAGFSGFVSKPIVPADIINTIRKAFNLSVLVSRPEQDEQIIPDLSNKRILVVEDQELNQEIIINVLNKTKAQIDIANNGEEAVIKVTAEKYDLVLMDIQMPVMNGLDATIEIRKLDGMQITQLPILAMSANAMSDDIENSKKVGMNDHITKPVIPGLLYKKLTEHINMTANTAELSLLAHIDTQSGISHTDGNYELYLKMLKDFAWQSPKQAQELSDAIEDGKHSKASDVVHIIKGIAGNIGANDLMQLAGELERSLEVSSEDLDQVCKKVTNEVNMLIDEIHAAFENKIETNENPAENIKNS